MLPFTNQELPKLKCDVLAVSKTLTAANVDGEANPWGKSRFVVSNMATANVTSFTKAWTYDKDEESQVVYNIKECISIANNRMKTIFPKLNDAYVWSTDGVFKHLVDEHGQVVQIHAVVGVNAFHTLIHSGQQNTQQNVNAHTCTKQCQGNGSHTRQPTAVYFPFGQLRQQGIEHTIFKKSGHGQQNVGNHEAPNKGSQDLGQGVEAIHNHIELLQKGIPIESKTELSQYLEDYSS